MKVNLYLLLLWVVSTLSSCEQTNQSSTPPSPSTPSISGLSGQPIQKIAFGSCNRTDLPQPLWQEIGQQKPDLFIWGGDNVYADRAGIDSLQGEYEKQKAQAGYAEFRSKLPIIGIWDDHDYGKNDGGSDFIHKERSQQLTMDFLEIDKDSPLRNQQGIYQGYDVGQPDHLVRILLLDTRYHRDELLRSTDGNQRYQPNLTGDILGEEQWNWLEDQLTNSPAQVHILVTSIQFLPIDHGYEKWDNFPQSRQRLIDLLITTQAKHPIFLSGDRHIGELSAQTIEGLQEPLLDLTSSGLTHSWNTLEHEENQFRISEIATELNYGLLTFDWQKQELTLEVKGEEGANYIRHTLSIL